jgi:SAM-dependent methyltransferase
VNAFTDREALVGAAYADASKLADRQAIYRFVERPWPSDGGRVVGALGSVPPADQLVVDVGCGNGNDLRDLRAAGFTGLVAAVDLSAGMLRTIPEHEARVNADAARLPLADGAADLALAMHMLYHCPDIPATVAELRRVVRPGGSLVVSTNSVEHLQELRAMWTSALQETVAGVPPPWQAAAGRFALEEAAVVLGTSFDEVVLHRTDNRLLVPEVAPVVAYVESTRDLSGHEVSDTEWRAAIALLAGRVRSAIADEGALALTVVKGVLVAR